MNNIILLTGRPGSGKTTLIRGMLAPPFTDRIKSLPEITLIDVTPQNRAELVDTILGVVEQQAQE